VSRTDLIVILQETCIVFQSSSEKNIDFSFFLNIMRAASGQLGVLLGRSDFRHYILICFVDGNMSAGKQLRKSCHAITPTISTIKSAAGLLS
jgi:hypothetical protein